VNGARGIPSGSPTARNHVVTGGFGVIDSDATDGQHRDKNMQ
jgi:hypothetical protein